jgi:nitrate reductase gamma subunit
MLIAQILVVIGFLVCAYGIYRRYIETTKRALPGDRSALKGNPSHGITYAFTTGMMPWAKESTRIHKVAYLRGIGFHIGIFAALGALVISPFWGFLPAWMMNLLGVVLALGTLLGAAGGIMRLVEHNLRGLSLPDDHFAIWLVTIFMAAGALAVWNASFLVPFYVISTVTLVYIPFGKIRHCLYFFFSRIFFGKFFGRRAVFPHPAEAK